MDSTSDGHRPGPGAAASGDLTDPAAATDDSQRWHRVFTGESRELSTLRHWLSSVLPDCPARDDVLSVATELAGNAIQHTASGNGGWFAVEVTLDHSVVAVAVADCGGPEEPHIIEDLECEHGRGLLLVQGLSIRTGYNGDDSGRLVWAHIAWEHKDDDVAAAPEQPAVHDRNGALRRRFPGVPAWYGRSTLLAWSLADPDFPVTPATSPETAESERKRTTSRAGRHRGRRQ
ncbi:MAG TPA: ATP-binding protein [Streptosporangiaceae bacterium]|nr:ATP-binding protein [Streptosporangiaceae bacterium]